MTKRMLVDATHPEEVRVAIVDDYGLVDLDVETSDTEQIKGNIYLARVVRVEPSLQAAFIDFNGSRHGFLSANDIHSKYFPEGTAEPEEPAAESAEHPEGERPFRRRTPPIQKVLTRNQTLMVQVVKEARGTKGASLTTHLSIPGRYTVIMPENQKGGGISRKIEDSEERKQLKEVLHDLHQADGGSLIIRTAGLGRTKVEIKRDLNYLQRLWKQIQEKAAQSKGPTLLYEEGDLITRTIRDLYTTDMAEILIEGTEGYRRGKDFMRLLMPRYVKVVQPYKERQPIFSRFKVEEQIESMHERVISLKAGGYVVIDSTEALVAVDVNSGRSTREKDIETTALKTNLEAAAEVARQLRLRDLGGLIVIDFIDMEDKKNVLAVEKRLKEAVKDDRARIQLGRISQFGLMELSRQRLRPAFSEANQVACPRCQGRGTVRSFGSSSIQIFRRIESDATCGRFNRLVCHAPLEVAAYLLNQKRAQLHRLEEENGIVIIVNADPAMETPDFRMERSERPAEEIERNKPKELPPAPVVEEAEDDDALDDELGEDEGEDGKEGQEAEEASTPGTEDSPSTTRRRRRRRRRRRGAGTTPADGTTQEEAAAPSDNGSEPPPVQEPTEAIAAPPADESNDGEDTAQPTQPARTSPARRRRRRRRPSSRAATGESSSEGNGDATASVSDAPQGQAPNPEGSSQGGGADHGQGGGSDRNPSSSGSDQGSGSDHS